MECKYECIHFLKLVRLRLCKFKNAERNTYERNAKPTKAQHISTLTQSSPLISSFLPASALIQNSYPWAASPRRIHPGSLASFWVSLNLLPCNVSLNIQSPLMSVPQESHQALSLKPLASKKAQLSYNNLTKLKKSFSHKIQFQSSLYFMQRIQSL